MSFFRSGGGQNGGSGRAGGATQQTALLTGPPQLFVNPNQLQFQTGTQNFSFSQADNSQQGQLQLNTGGAPLLLQPPVNFVTDQLSGLGQLITQAAVTQSQQNLQNIMNLGSVLAPSLQMTDQQAQSGPQAGKQRVFTGAVTKIHDNFGFIDEEVFFQMGVVKGPVLPKEGDRVLVEADFNPSMPFKWNATRVQIVNMGGGAISSSGQSSSSHSQNQSHSQQQQQQQQSGYQQQQQSQQSGYQQQQQQMMNFPTSMSSVQKPLQAPPPPAISGRAQPVSIVSNPHSVYSSRVSANVQMPPESLGGNRRGPIPSSSQHPGHMMSHEASIMSAVSANAAAMSLPSLLQHMDSHDGGRERDRDRRDRDPSRDRDRKDRFDKDRDRDRQRDRSPDRIRERDRDRERRDRSPRERRRTRSKTPVRERRAIRRSVTPKKRSRERERERGKPRERSPERVQRDRSPPVVRGGLTADRIRNRRSRSRETIKSSDDKSVVSNDRARSTSPRRKTLAVKAPIPPRYSVQVPQYSFDMGEVNGVELKRRYPNLYVPTDFFLAKASWMEAFPIDKPFSLGKACPVHILGRHVKRIEIVDKDAVHERFKEIPAVLDAPDSSCTFKVKVMILSSASLETLFKKSGCVSEESIDEKDTYQPVQRLLNFLVGVKSGTHELLALGGSWSASLDGVNPQSDPKVLVNTAIRCVKAQAAIDLTRCKHWYRFMELYYRRSNGNLETVVYFLPDTSPCVPSQSQWDSIKKAYRLALHGHEKEPSSSAPKKSLNRKSSKSSETKGISAASEVKVDAAPTPPEAIQDEIADGDVTSDAAGTEGGKTEESAQNPQPVSLPEEVSTTVESEEREKSSKVTVGLESEDVDILRMEVVDECNGDELIEDEVASLLVQEDAEHQGESGVGLTSKADASFDIYDDIVEVAGELLCPGKKVGQDESVNHQEEGVPEKHVQEGEDQESEEQHGTHFSLLDPKAMNVAKLREELGLRNLNTKGLKSQLTTRLAKALKEEEAEAKTETVQKEKDLEGVSSSANEIEIGPSTTMETDAEPPATEHEEEPMIRLVDPSTIFESVQEEEQGEAGVEDPKMEDGEIKEDNISCSGKDSSSEFPIIKAEMSSEEKKIWERRYMLPKNPKILINPSATSLSASSSSKSFDCALMGLHSLRDYRLVDRREESFEVSLFSEFFFDMLQRDFAFRIYTEIYKQWKINKSSVTHNKEDHEKSTKNGKDKDKDGNGEPSSKKRKMSTVSSSVVTPTTEASMQEKPKTLDPYLLMSFAFFDQTRCGYIMEIDLEEICATLGIGITRHQLRKMVQKIVTKGNLEYRKLTDKREGEPVSGTWSKEDRELTKSIYQGNKSLLPVFTFSSGHVLMGDGPNHSLSNDKLSHGQNEAVVATVDGQVVDVRKIKDDLEKAEKERTAADANANVLKNSLNEAKNQVSELKKSNENLKEELSKTKDSLKKLESTEKAQKEELETFKWASERFVDRVRDLLPPIPGPKAVKSVVVTAQNSSTPSDFKDVKEKDKSEKPESSASKDKIKEKKESAGDALKRNSEDVKK